MYTHNFKLAVITERNLTRDTVLNLVHSLLAAGAADAQATCDDRDMEQSARDTADDACSLDCRIV